MRFFWKKRASRHERPRQPAPGPYVHLLHTDWDDFGYRTTFDVHFFDEHGHSEQLESVKILQLGHMITSLPNPFDQLPESFVSLGTSLKYYERADTLLGPNSTAYHTALRDVVANPALQRLAEPDPGFRTSLLRFSESEKAFHEAGRFFGRADLTPNGFAFEFACRLTGFGEDHVLPFDYHRLDPALDPDDAFPRRITCLIGKNGTGKSGVLARLASALSGDAPDAGRFPSGRPALGRTICISYGVFQPFAVPTRDTSSYRYCGLRSADGKIEPDTLLNRTLQSIATIMASDKREYLQEYLSLTDIAGEAADHVALDNANSMRTLLSTLSSGQRMVVSIAADLISNIDKQSLVLVDEPEIYLHPTLLSTLLRMLERVLHKFDSYAIIATHSPIVVQEVPSRCIHVFEREGDVPIIRKLTAESFGASLSELVSDVFGVNPDDKNYQTILRELTERYSRDSVVRMFDEGLPVNAALFLRALSERE